ncbi:hypothetical protein R3P38DRAFT_3482571 [Favolaschia claudopus]|uniref:Uncharacterized protein n=1 Tax=Favolaschia claudopus TaxID=2862362 RepID=A0AAV9Z855_9AGAR
MSPLTHLTDTHRDNQHTAELSMIGISHLQETYLPRSPEDLLVNFSFRPSLEALLDRLPTIFADAHTTSSALGPALESALAILLRRRPRGIKAVELIREYKAEFPEIFATFDSSGDAAIAKACCDPDARLKEVKAWLKMIGVLDLEPVSLFCDHLTKKTVTEIEELHRQQFELGDQESHLEGHPAISRPQAFACALPAPDAALLARRRRFTILGSMDVMWDVPLMSGVTLGDRCSQYRGSTAEFNTRLNLIYPQIVTSTNPMAVHNRISPLLRQRGDPPMAYAQMYTPGFRPPAQPSVAPVAIMTNPNCGGRGDFPPSRHGAFGQNRAPLPTAAFSVQAGPIPTAAFSIPPNGQHDLPPAVLAGGAQAMHRGGRGRDEGGTDTCMI